VGSWRSERETLEIAKLVATSNERLQHPAGARPALRTLPLLVFRFLSRSCVDTGQTDEGEHSLLDLEAEGTISTTSGDVEVRVVLILNITRTVDSQTDPDRAQERREATRDDLGNPRGV
jgi:hypothetical protein